MNLFLGRTHFLPPSLALKPINASLASSTQASPPNPIPHFAVDYLIQSCGLSSDQALAASGIIPHLKSPDKPNAVLRFLRSIGVSEPDIATAVSRDARILCSSLEKNWKPNVAKLREVGFSPADISGIVAGRPYLFRYNFAAKVDFWTQSLGPAEFVLRGNTSLLCSSLDHVLIPNLTFLKEECGLNQRQIIRLVKSNPRLISCRPEVLRKQTERAEKLGVSRSSGAFIYALIVVGYLTQSTIDARLKNLKSLGLSEDDVTTIVRKLPLVLSQSENKMRSRIKFLINESGCDESELVQNPSLLTYSLEMRLAPRNVVRKLLKSNEIPAAEHTLASFMKPTEERFLAKYVLPYVNVVPGLHEAYADASPGK